MSTAKHYEFTFHFSHIPPVMLRGTHALIVVRDEQGKFILGSKHIYPPGIYRLVGGGIENDEDVHVGAQRELEEELGITVPIEQLQEVAIITAHVTDADHDTVFTTHLFATNIGDQEVHPSDDLDDIVRFSRDQMQELITRYSTLQDTVITIDRDYTIGKASTASSPFSWKDYGTFYGKVHEIALQLTDA